MTLDKQEAQELAYLRAKFRYDGGRGVETAERIDQLQAKEQEINPNSVTYEVTIKVTIDPNEYDPPSLWSWPLLLDVAPQDVEFIGQRLAPARELLDEDREMLNERFFDEVGVTGEQFKAALSEAHKPTTYYDARDTDRDEPLPAEYWAWQTGNRWVAVPEDSILDWWDGADEADLAARPEPWYQDIQSVPTSGTLIFRDRKGNLIEQELS